MKKVVDFVKNAWGFVEKHRWKFGTAAVVVIVAVAYVRIVNHFTSDSNRQTCPPYTTAGTGQSTPLQAPSGPVSQQAAKAKASLRAIRRLARQQGKAPSLESAEPTQPINVTGTEGIARANVLLTASPAIPRGLNAAQIKVQVPQKFRRINEKSSTVYLPQPKHSAPIVLENGKVVSFEFCINLANLPVQGGTYAGQVVTTAPGYEPATLTVPINVKDSDWFVKVWLGALILAFLLLLLQAGQAEWTAQVARNAADQSRSKALKKPLSDLFGFWPTTAVAIAAVFGATWGVYAAAPGWGADHVGSFIALIGTAIAAAGLGNLVTGPKAASEEGDEGAGEAAEIDEATGDMSPEESDEGAGEAAEIDEATGDMSPEESDEGAGEAAEIDATQPTPEGTKEGHKPRARRGKGEGSGKPDLTGEEAGS